MGYAKKIITIALFMAVLLTTPVMSVLMDTAVIRTEGSIRDVIGVTAQSGYWQDIQAAVNQVVANGGIGNVYIPEGTFDFVNVGESWTGARVVIPAGVSIFGEPNQRTSGLSYDGVGQNPNDQVVQWKTVLRLPWDVPGNWEGSANWFFKVTGSGDPSKPSRF